MKKLFLMKSCSTTQIKYLTMLTTLFYFPDYAHYVPFYFSTIKWKSLPMLTALLYFHYYSNKISDYAHYTVLLHYY